MKKIYTHVFRNSLGDCTANGLTSQLDSVDLYYSDDLSIDLEDIPDDSLVLIKRELWGEPAWYAKPASLLKNNTHSMCGGNFVYTSDSRFPARAPISVHDRVETY